MSQADLSQARVVVVLVVMRQCPACHEFLPRFRRVAAKYARCVPSVIVDASDPQQAPVADRFQVRATPTLLVLRRPVGQIRLEGNVSDAEIERAFAMATRGLRCPL